MDAMSRIAIIRGVLPVTKSNLQSLGTYYGLMDVALRMLQSSVISMSEYQVIEQKAAAEAHLSETSIFREKWREVLDFTGV